MRSAQRLAAAASWRSPESKLTAIMTDRYAVIGHPVKHSKSPQIHTEFARQTGQDLTYGIVEAPLDGFVAAVTVFRADGGKGMNVTAPFKFRAFSLANEASERGARARATRSGSTAIRSPPRTSTASDWSTTSSAISATRSAVTVSCCLARAARRAACCCPCSPRSRGCSPSRTARRQMRSRCARAIR